MTDYVLAYYHHETVARAALKRKQLWRQRTLILKTDAQGTTRIIARNLWFLWIGLFVGSVLGLLSTLILHQSAAIIIPLAFSLFGWSFARIPKRILDAYPPLLLQDEVLLVILPWTAKSVTSILTSLRAHDGEHPVTFLLSTANHAQRPPLDRAQNMQTQEDIATSATHLAQTLVMPTHTPRQRKTPFTALRHLQREMHIELQRLDEMSKIEHRLSMSAETLTENAYVIDGNVLDVLTNFPAKFYRDLPMAINKQHTLPRIYVIAKELVRAQTGNLTAEAIYNYLQAFQQVSPLKIGELWAFPLVLRLALIEQLSTLLKREIWRQTLREQVEFWTNRILATARREPENLPRVLQALRQGHSPFNAYFAYVLFEQLFDNIEFLAVMREWIERDLGVTVSDLRQRTQLEEAAEQAIVSGTIRSLIEIARISWPDRVESLSRIDAILSQDTAQIYLKMDFATRDSYRKRVEELAKKYQKTEPEVAETCIRLAQQGADALQQHVGFYLVDHGQLPLETELNGRPPWLPRIVSWLKRATPVMYLAGIGGLTFVLTVVLFVLFFHHTPLLITLLTTVLAIIPLSEIVLEVFQWVLNKCSSPRRLPKMAFDRLGVPDDCRTLVVIPTLLQDVTSIDDDLQRLQIHYLGNPDANLRFAIFSDFRDTATVPASDDEFLLQKIKGGIANLNQKYGAGKFFLFHRQRVFSATEGSWIGWERKRGKLQQLNTFLLGTGDATILHEGLKQDLDKIRFVITLDGDTELPKDSAAKLISTLAHPLNIPRLSTANGRCELLHGYVIIQPRVEATLPSTNATRFAQLFSTNVGTSPYQHLVSNVYQDFMAEGTYHGKGIYDVQAFHAMVSHRIPEAHVLSHDLLEGALSRVGFASDLVLLDTFPPNYLTFSLRQQRWIRGDWQIIDWLLPKTPTAKKDERELNPLTMLNQWKILDNLRRSLLPIALLFLLLTSWGAPCPLSWMSTDIVLLTLILPSLSLFSFDWLGGFYSFVSVLQQWKTFLLKTLYRIAVLPYEVYLTVDAIARVFYRRKISKRLLLQWTTSTTRVDHQLQSAYRHLFLITGFGLSMGTLLFLTNPSAWPNALVFVLAWILAPFIVSFFDRPPETDQQGYSRLQRTLIRKWARLTWRFFDDFAAPHWHWLPPDNFQEALRIEEAGRTSPTNIGLYLTALASATRFGYISLDTAAERLGHAIASMKQLERFQGHFLNWYDLGNLKPLPPSYISTVDSGNLLAALWTTGIAIEQWEQEPLIGAHTLAGLQDTIDVLEEQIKGHPSLVHPVKELQLLLARPFQRAIDIVKQIRQARSLCIQLQEALAPYSDKNILYWSTAVIKQVEQWNLLCDRYFKWLEILAAPPHSMHANVHQVLNCQPSLSVLAAGSLLKDIIDNPQGGELFAAFSQAQWFAGERIGELERLQDDLQLFAAEINMNFLYDANRRLFAIGYNVTDRRMDTSYYDLLASEARLASLVAIAKGDVPAEHWWALGRPYGVYGGRALLLSWGGTMFEYLMPSLFNYNHASSLLDQVCRMAIQCQIDYGEARGIPWGISEAAYSRLDARHIYQYRSFGIPALGLRRGLENDLVVSPYSSMLALPIDPIPAFKNLHRMAKVGMLSHYGFFESIDYSRQVNEQGTRGVIIYTYMAHHAAMSFLAMDNILHDNPIVRNFHSDPRIRSIEFLLYERPPTAQQPTLPKDREPRPNRLTAFYPRELKTEWNSPGTPLPGVNLLSNGTYALMMTNTGSGYSRWKQFDLTRWRSDTTQDPWGTFCYLKDMESAEYTAITYQPTRHSHHTYAAHFTPEKAEYHFKGMQLIATTEVLVDPSHPAEIRKISIHNISDRRRTLSLTTYAELALAEHAADLGHPAFNKMFIETEAIPEKCAIVAHRRLRTAKEEPIWIGLTIATFHPSSPLIEWETSREHFIGRGRALEHPVAMEGPLTKRVGYVLDPIFSLRYHFTLDPDEQQVLSLITLAANSRDELIKLIDTYRDYTATKHCVESAWAFAQLQLRHFHVHQTDFHLFTRLASLLIYPHAELRPSTPVLMQNNLPIKRLWAHGISGDLPILILRVADSAHLPMVIQLLTAHAFWQARGLDIDLILLNDEATTYDAPLSHRLQQAIRSYSTINAGERKGKGTVTLLTMDQLPADELRLLLAVAHIVLLTSRGSLAQQIAPARPPKTVPAPLKPKATTIDRPTVPLPFFEVKHFNGLGGFTFDDKEYVIYLDAKAQTPAPWSNVLANPQFGALVSESGVDAVWKFNSQTNRLTPWSNDPVSPSLGQILYIRDDEQGDFWTITPQPIRDELPYRIRHSQGYTAFEHHGHGIKHLLTLFVPPDPEASDPVLVQILSLTNTSDKPCHLSLFYYVDWVLGPHRERTQRHIQTEWNDDFHCLVAKNPQNIDHPTQLAFIGSSVAPDSYTGDRREFIGRNQSLRRPDALKRQTLAKTCGAGLDPCGAIQIKIVLLPGESHEFTFLLGEADDGAHLQKLFAKYQAVEAANTALSATRTWWDRTLETIQVSFPDDAAQTLLNRWLLYQSIACRMWGRTAFYQSSGAFGFRDQLQDAMTLVYVLPALAREHLLLSAAHQFPEGDVLHWWHPEGGGVRTRISDDFLWLPLAVSHYVNVTGDHAILQELIAFVEGPQLASHEHEIYLVPEVSPTRTSLLDHCQRALKRGMTAGEHGLPLMGGGDWNDGMNQVGIEGKGESVWLAWFTIYVMQTFAKLEAGDKQTYLAHATRLAKAVEETSWDGRWYMRAFYDDGSPLGSKTRDEAKIDSISQSWAILSAAGHPERSATAMQSFKEFLQNAESRLNLLLTPPFNRSEQEPGYIKGYPPGVRENGGQYTHAAVWAAMAAVRLWPRDEGIGLLQMINPLLRTQNASELATYRVEPYVIAADIYSNPEMVGRGGWTWYTGASAWLYRAWLEEVFGFTLRGEELTLNPKLLPTWNEVTLTYRYKSTSYRITMRATAPDNEQPWRLVLDGNASHSPTIKLIDDGQTHQITLDK